MGLTDAYGGFADAFHEVISGCFGGPRNGYGALNCSMYLCLCLVKLAVRFLVFAIFCLVLCMHFIPPEYYSAFPESGIRHSI